MTEALKLEPLSFPLTDIQLIEASAGTGKTYTITALYLRLLLGLSDVRQGEKLGPKQILVVTFTEAATEELRDRIRSRIGEARRVFQRGEAGDPLLQALLDQYPEHDKAAELLEMAAREMDEAAIFTIHGFCQRMLSQHAFESGSLFENELIQDETPWLRQALLDFWRNRLYGLSPAVGRAMLQLWKTPDELLRELRPWLHTSDLTLQPQLPEIDLDEAYARRSAQIEQFCRQWLACEEDLAALIACSDINKRSYTKARTPQWLATLSQWAERGGEPDKDTQKVVERFRQSTLEGASKSKPPRHALFVQLDQLVESEVPLRELMLQQAYRQVGAALAKAKADRRLLAFDDLLSGLGRALLDDPQQLLAGAIRKQYPVALIDEFQDTDPQQYRIFSTLYGGQPDCGLIMIGDPKQAIYAFRGADIFTYIAARRAVAQPWTLDTNWRSTSEMIRAVNRLFEQCDTPFIYDRDIPFQPVNAAAKADKTPLTLAGKPLAALQVWQSEELLTRSRYRQQFSQATAAEIELLLDSAKIGEQPLQAGQIAILVRDRYEADAVRGALSERQIPSVYLSNRDSVFNCAEAMDLYRILQAVQEPTDERALRAALATPLLALDVPALDLLNREEQAWEAAVQEFMEYRECWHRLGVLPMLHRLMHRRRLAVQLLQQSGGERRLTDLLHLGELLQQASTRIEGLAGLLRWFTDQVMGQEGAADEQLLRLESDRNLVTVVTIHKSKGLEYPVVFLPFVSDFREAKTGFYHDEDQRAIWALDNNEDAVAAADGERLAEELRLLYVALTRAVYRCYVGASEIKVGNVRKSQLSRSALGHLLGSAERELPEALEALGGEPYGISVTGLPETGADGQQDLFTGDEVVQPPSLQARSFNGRINRDWRLSSYSALSHQSGSHSLPQPGVDLEVMDETTPMPEPELPEQNIFSFPRGARAGTFLHSLFEEVPFDQPDAEESQDTICSLLIRNGYGTEEEQPWLAVINQLMDDVLNANLEGMRLSQLGATDKLVEMEFLLPVAQLDAPRLNQLISRHDPLSAQAAPLQFDQLKGMLKGFVDLVFRVDGRYYIADYKSNHLGDSLEDYHPQALETAMLEHRYDLQYQLYSLALHRLLQQRLPDYDPAQHLGGVFYLFLRGMKVGEQSGVFYRPANVTLTEQLDQLFLGNGAAV